MAKRKTKSSALGDDPLAWIAGADEAKENAVKKTKSKKAKSKKAKSKKTKVKTNRKSKVREEKIKTDKTRLILDSIITINDAQTMYTQLRSLLESKQDITIDASAVEMLDTAILQLLLAFVN
ncbi:MAG: STAS domain-containing protein, partial [Proteobacteria bacterium]|nr:STAS domain-containing protein [Pseudomonadota bacterium]